MRVGESTNSSWFQPSPASVLGMKTIIDSPLGREVIVIVATRFPLLDQVAAQKAYPLPQMNPSVY